jgi:ubiquinone/menaquinone biosynthesis C-methylase UbiE
MKDEEIRKAVREGYSKIALQENSCCGPANTCGCGCGSPPETVSKAIGYSDEELNAVPEGANLGLGCGNPTALASLKEGEEVLDLGSGAGFDCFLAADKVGESGRVIGVDMTAEMIEKARENARKGDYRNVEFRLGEIENLPVADNSVDVVISNCVINLSPDKSRVFKEAFRALKPGGRVMVSDIALLKELPDAIKGSVEAYIGCVAGATTKQEYLSTVAAAGFGEVEVVSEVSTKGLYEGNTAQAIAENLGKSPGIPGIMKEAADSIVSMQVRAVKSK